MGIDSCYHGDFVVVYDAPYGKDITCPVCRLEKELDETNSQIKEQQENQDE